MLERSGTFLGVALIAALTACAGPQANSITPEAASNAKMKPQAACGGTNGVRPIPCPITITDAYGVKVVIADIHRRPYVWYALPKGPCGSVCKPQMIGNAYYLIQPGKKCGAGIQSFRAFHYNFRYIGQAHLQVTNQYCPG